MRRNWRSETEILSMPMVRIAADLYTVLVAHAQADGRSAAGFINWLLREALTEPATAPGLEERIEHSGSLARRSSHRTFPRAKGRL